MDNKYQGRSWAEIYDELLTCQAKISNDIEQSLFWQGKEWKEAVNILDFGSGNACYADFQSRRYPEKKIICVEKNHDLVLASEKRIVSKNIKVIEGSFDSIGKLEEKIDFAYARHVLSYLTDEERRDFISWIDEITTENAELLVIDAADDLLKISPSLPLLERGNDDFKEELKKNGGNREIKDLIGQQLGERGFKLKSSMPLVIHSEMHQRKPLISMFLKSVIELDHGSPLSDEARAEVDHWLADESSYIQYGLFGSIYSR